MSALQATAEPSGVRTIPRLALASVRLERTLVLFHHPHAAELGTVSAAVYPVLSGWLGTPEIAGALGVDGEPQVIDQPSIEAQETRILAIGGARFPLDSYEVTRVRAWLAAVYGQ